MNAVGSIQAVMGRIAAIESRLGVRAAPAPTSPAGATPTAPGAMGASEAIDASIGLGAGGDAGFGDLLAQAEQLLTQATVRTGASPFPSQPTWGSPAMHAVPAASFGDHGAAVPGSGNGTLPADTPFAGLFEAAAARWGIPAEVLAAVGHVESRFRTDAVSPAGAIGVMQFMPATAAGMGVDPTDPASAIDGAGRLLRQLQDRFGSLELALGAYNVGPGTIAKTGGIVPGSQSEKYVNAVLAASEQFS